MPAQATELGASRSYGSGGIRERSNFVRQNLAPRSAADFRKRLTSNFSWKQVGDRCPSGYMAKWCAAPRHVLIALFLC